MEIKLTQFQGKWKSIFILIHAHTFRSFWLLKADLPNVFFKQGKKRKKNEEKRVEYELTGVRTFI